MPAETPRCGGPAGRRITVGSYNIHSCVGSDNRYDPGRIQSVIADLDADVVGLQEVGERARHARSIDHFDFLSDETGMHVIAGPNLIDNGSPYGNVMLSRWPVTDYRLIRLNVPNREPRGAIAAVVRCVDRNVRFRQYASRSPATGTTPAAGDVARRAFRCRIADRFSGRLQYVGPWPACASRVRCPVERHRAENVPIEISDPCVGPNMGRTRYKAHRYRSA